MSLGAFQHWWGYLGAAALFFYAGMPDGAAETPTPKHLGVASCASDNCHGAVVPAPHSSVRQNEYLIWSQETDPARIDKHHLAYKVLLEKRSRRIAGNLGIADPVTASLCLNCHADNVPLAQRDQQFDIADGVGCEACHGGAERWLSVHLTYAGHQANLQAGLFPLEDPAARAKKCLSCHFGDASDPNRFVTHRIMSAGHPRMGFELDTYTMAEPAHFVVDRAYVARKGQVNDAQIWAVGQAVSLEVHANALLAPALAPKGIFPELVLFDCQSCHHSYDWQRSHQPKSGAMAGWPPLYNANAAMLRVIAESAAPQSESSLMLATTGLDRGPGEDWTAVGHAAAQLREQASALLTALSSHDISPQDAKLMARGILALSLSGQSTDYAAAEAATMALGAIASDMRKSGLIGDAQLKLISGALDGLNRSVADDHDYHPETFVNALQVLEKALLQGNGRAPPK